MRFGRSHRQLQEPCCKRGPILYRRERRRPGTRCSCFARDRPLKLGRRSVCDPRVPLTRIWTTLCIKRRTDR